MIVCTTEITLYDQNETPQGSLSSESHSVPCDPDGSNPDLTGASSTLQVILGDEDITDDYSLICTPSSGVTGTKSGYTYTVTGMTALAGFVDFVATKAGAATIQKRFSIVKQPKGNTGDPGAPGVDAPRCRGLYPYGTAPSSPVAGDLVVWYSTTTEDCGIYQYANNTWSKLTAPTPDQVGRCFIHILSAVVAAVRTDSAGNTISVAYGVSADYAPNSVAFEILLVNFLFARNITLQETGYLKSHDYTESSGLPTAGFMLDVANQIIKAYGAKFVSATIKDAAITNATVSGKATLAELILSGVTAGANIIKGYNDNVSRNIPNGALNTLVSYQICATGTIRAYINAKIVAGSDLVVHVVKNSTTVLELTSGYPDYSLSTSFAASDFSVDIAVNAGDIIHLKAQATPYSCSYKNFRICCAENPGILSYIGS